MAVIKEIFHKNITIFLWSISETEDELTQGLDNIVLSEINKNKLFKRRVEKTVQAQLLIHAKIDPLLVSYENVGKPIYKKKGVHISFSHAGQYVTLMVSNTNCGIDIEKDNPKIARVSSKFLNQKEVDFLNHPGALAWIWCIKEAVFKYFGEHVIFKDDIIVDQLNPIAHTAVASYRGVHGAGNFEINLNRFENYYLAYTKAYFPI